MILVTSYLNAIAVSVLLGLLLGFANGSLDPRVALVSLGGGLIAGIVTCWRGRRDMALPRLRGWAWLPIGIFCLFSLRAFLWLIFCDGDELRVLSPNNLGDMALHLTFINYFANGAPFWPDSPIFAAGKLTYAAGMDVFNSLLALAGVDVARGLIATSLLCALATGAALLRWGRAFAMLGFLCNGGLTGFACLFTGDGEMFFQDYQAEWAWKNLPLAVLVTQRGFHFALPAGLLLLSSWRTRFFLDGRGWMMPLGGELLLYATLPFFHLHTFLALSFLLAAFFVARTPARRQIARLVALAFIPATLLVYVAAGMLKSNAEPMWEDMTQFDQQPGRPPNGSFGWQPGWMVNDEPTLDVWNHVTASLPAAEPLSAHGRFLVFWLGNFGLLLLLAVPLALILLRPFFRIEVSVFRAFLIAFGITAITPLLGRLDGYQNRPLRVLLVGPGPNTIVWSAVTSILALTATVTAFVSRQRLARSFALRWLLSGFAILCVLNLLLAVLHESDSRFPLLPANAVPLVFGTAAFCLLLCRISRKPGHDQWPATAAFSALYLFFLCCNVRFATWDWDNTKLMVWAYLLFLPFLWDLLIVRWKPWVRGFVCAFLFFSGFVSLFGGFTAHPGGYSIARLSELDALSVSLRNIPVTATFAAQPTYNHPLLLLGRKLVMGFEGHLGSHGISYQATRQELDGLMNGLPEWRLIAARLGARYLFFGPGERETWPDSAQPWRMGACLVASGEWGELFDLETPPIPLDDPLAVESGEAAPTLR